MTMICNSRSFLQGREGKTGSDPEGFSLIFHPGEGVLFKICHLHPKPVPFSNRVSFPGSMKSYLTTEEKWVIIAVGHLPQPVQPFHRCSKRPIHAIVISRDKEIAHGYF